MAFRNLHDFGTTSIVHLMRYSTRISTLTRPLPTHGTLSMPHTNNDDSVEHVGGAPKEQIKMMRWIFLIVDANHLMILAINKRLNLVRTYFTRVDQQGHQQGLTAFTVYGLVGWEIRVNQGVYWPSEYATRSAARAQFWGSPTIPTNRTVEWVGWLGIVGNGFFAQNHSRSDNLRKFRRS